MDVDGLGECGEFFCQEGHLVNNERFESATIKSRNIKSGGSTRVAERLSRCGLSLYDQTDSTVRQKGSAAGIKTSGSTFDSWSWILFSIRLLGTHDGSVP